MINSQTINPQRQFLNKREISSSLYKVTGFVAGMVSPHWQISMLAAIIDDPQTRLGLKVNVLAPTTTGWLPAKTFLSSGSVL